MVKTYGTFNLRIARPTAFTADCAKEMVETAFHRATGIEPEPSVVEIMQCEIKVHITESGFQHIEELVAELKRLHRFFCRGDELIEEESAGYKKKYPSPTDDSFSEPGPSQDGWE